MPEEPGMVQVEPTATVVAAVGAVWEAVRECQEQVAREFARQVAREPGVLPVALAPPQWQDLKPVQAHRQP